MILTAYFDESGTHKGSPVVVMAGILGTKTQWRHFQTDLDRLRSKYEFSVFHAKDLKARSGEFRKWTDAKALSLVTELAASVSSRLMEGATIAIPPVRYASEYAAVPMPSKPRDDTLYGLSFRLALGHMTCEVIRRLQAHKNFSRTRPHVVLERGNSHQGDAERVFDEMKRMLDAEGIHLLSDFTLATKREADPLMIADFLAFTQFQRGVPDQASGMSGVSAVGRSSRSAGLTHLHFSEGGLEEARLAQEHIRKRMRAGRSAF